MDGFRRVRPAVAALSAVVLAASGAVASSAFGGPGSDAQAATGEVVVASPMDNGAYFFGSQLAAEGSIDELFFSVYATEIDRAADGAIWVRDYRSIVRIAPDGQSFRRVLGVDSDADLEDPLIGTPLENVGSDPSVVPTRLMWEGGRRTAFDPQGRLVFVDRNSVFRLGTDGLIEHLAGNGVEGSSGDGGPAVDAEIAPTLLQVDATGNVWFVDIGGTQLRRVGTDGIITTVATEAQGISDFAVAVNGDVALLIPAANAEFESVLGVRVISAADQTSSSVTLDDDQFCFPESGGASSQSQDIPQIDGSSLEFLGSDESGVDGWSRCTVDLGTGSTQRTSLGLDPSVDRRSNIEVGDDAFWYMRYDDADLSNSGLIRQTLAGSEPEPGPRVSLGDQSGLERDSQMGSVFVPVYLSEPAAESVVVSFYTVDGTAVAGQDYARWGTPARPRTITIPAGQVQGQINVPVLADGEVEFDESFSVVLASVAGGDSVIGDDTGVATIVDADGVSVDDPAITVSSPTVVEGDVGQRRAQFQIHLSRAPVSPLTVTYATVDGTAVAGEDYVAKLPGTVVFAPGQISKTVDVLVNSNTVGDGDRAFTLDVVVAGGSPVEEITMAGVATIIDDELAAGVPCAPGTFSAEDGNEPCEPAPPGTFVDTEGALAATPCAPGSFQDQFGQTSCQLASIGSYVDFSGAVEATLCPEGTTTLALGAASADDCVAQPVGGAIDVDSAGNHSCALLANGTVRCWGDNPNGQLGNGTNTDSNVPVTVTGITDAVAISVSGGHSCAVLAGGTVRCWGLNSQGTLGNGTNTNSNVPVTVTGITDAVAIAAGSSTCAVLGDGTVRCWGTNFSGQLGDGTNIDSNVPVTVSGLTDAVAITAEGSHACAVLGDGTARCWGINTSGQLGDGTNTNSNVPVTVTGLTDAVGIDAGNVHSCALLADGAGRCWGSNIFGRLGDGTNTSSNVPVTVSGLAGAVDISGGGNHSCAVLGDGTARCWGRNPDGRLGDGTNIDSNVPVAVSGLSDAVAITAGNLHSCAVLGDGSARCWGINSSGQLGDGTNTDSNVPVTVLDVA